LVAERVDKKPLEKFKMKPTLGRFKKEPKQVQKKPCPFCWFDVMLAGFCWGARWCAKPIVRKHN